MTRRSFATDPTVEHMRGETFHGGIKFDMPIITEIAPNLWQGGVEQGLILPQFITHVVSLYPWIRYDLHNRVQSDCYLNVADSQTQDPALITRWADWVNACRATGPVLVHCQAGLNRSGLLAARTLYQDGFGTGEKIITWLRTVRSAAVLCNTAFAAEVESWT